MWYSALLLSHIAAAAATILLIGISLAAVTRALAQWYRPLILTIGGVAGFEIASGTMLAFVSSEVDAAGLVSHIALYLGACVAAELVLFYALRERAPLLLGATAAPALASLVFFFTALSLGF